MFVFEPNCNHQKKNPEEIYSMFDFGDFGTTTATMKALYAFMVAVGGTKKAYRLLTLMLLFMSFPNKCSGAGRDGVGAE